MTDWNKPHDADAEWAEAYRKLPDGCICEIEMHVLRFNHAHPPHRTFSLDYNNRCPAHFPELTQALKRLESPND